MPPVYHSLVADAECQVRQLALDMNSTEKHASAIRYSMYRRSMEQIAGLTMTLAVAVGATACTAHEESPAPSPSATSSANPDMSQLVSGCKIFRVYSQNRFPPLGTAVRTRPDVLASKSAKFIFAPDEVIPTDGWERTGEVAYPTNSKPIRNDIWYHVAPEGTSRSRNDSKINKAWVSFAGVRGEPTAPDPTGGHSPNLGKLAPLPSKCEIKPPID